MANSPNSEHRPVRVDELDGLRGMLAFWVVLSHIFCMTGFWEYFLAPRPGRWFLGRFIGADAAVECFIILSGFAISFLINRRSQSYGQFMQGRFFRIYPVYLVCFVFGLIAATLLTPFVLTTAPWNDSIYFEWNRLISASESSDKGAHIFWHMSLLHGAIPSNMLVNSTATFLTPAWSISLEWQYYLLAPFLARFVRSAVGLLALTVVAWLGWQFGYLWQNPHLAFLPAQLPLFLIGIGSYHLYEQFTKSSLRPSSAFAIPVAGVLAISILTSWHTLAIAIWAIGFGCIFVRGDDLFSRVLGIVRAVLLHRWLQRLGQISYPLYLVHWPLIIALLAVLLYWVPGISSFLAMIVMLVVGLPIILLASVLLHMFVEKPMMDLGKRLAKRTPRPQPAVEMAHT